MDGWTGIISVLTFACGCGCVVASYAMTGNFGLFFAIFCLVCFDLSY